MKPLKHLVDYKKFNEAIAPTTTPDDANKFNSELASWNKTYAQAFKFVNDLGNQLEPAYKQKATEAMQKLSLLLAKQPNLKFEVVAHTSSPKAGKAWGGSNEKLSQARAEFIQQALAKFGKVKPENLTAVGKGFTEPLVKDDTVGTPEQIQEKQLQNRRAEIRVSGNLAPVQISTETLQITQTQFEPDSIVPRSVENSRNFRQKYRVWNKARIERNKKVGGEKFPLYANTAEEIAGKVAAIDVREITPSADSELIKKLTAIGQYYTKSLLKQNNKIKIVGYSIDPDPEYALVLGAARAAYMKKLLMQLAPNIKVDMVVTSAEQAKGGMDKIMARLAFLNEDGTDRKSVV